MIQHSSLSYKDAGVDIAAGNKLVEHIKPLAASTRRPEVMAGIGGFGALFAVPGGYQQPILVAGTDGVGTKLRLALDLRSYDTVGIDLVAMSVNDVIVQGAEPLFFLDYYATGKLDVAIAAEVIKGISEGCKQAQCALIGGETAEMPSMYQGEDFDLAGFCVGIVEKAAIIDGSQVKAGDALLALASSGPHSNGYSLIRKVIAHKSIDLNQTFSGQTLGKTLLTPTRIYSQSILRLLKQHPIHAMAHITGGGLLENIPRVLPKHTKAVLSTRSWQWPEIFRWLQTQGNIATEEMHRTFNCGIGMVIALPEQEVARALALLQDCGETAWQVGSIESAHADEAQVQFI